MADTNEKRDAGGPDAPAYESGGKDPLFTTAAVELDANQVETDLNITGDDLAIAEEYARTLSLEDVRKIFEQVVKIHENDQNFPVAVLEKMKEFLGNDDIFSNPDAHEKLIHEMKVEAALIYNNSPYAEVRAVVDNTDDTSVPSSTIRSWTIGIFFVIAGAFVNQLFSIRQPTINIEANVAQLLAFPLGKAWERFLPDWRFRVFGNELSLNPGRFSKKEHMLITIMANVGFNVPYTNYVIWSQYLPRFFNQSYAGNFLYQILIALGTNYIGYGVAGICRRFLVYPAHCVWPSSLVTIALNASFHDEKNMPVTGPFRRVFAASRLRCFLFCFAGMFCYFWFPNYIFQALSYFNWMSWIAPDNLNLNTVTGMVNGLGINPIPTFDWNTLLFIEGNSPLVLSFFYWANQLGGMLATVPVVLGMWYTNIWNTGYLPINSNRIWDNTGQEYNISRAIDERGMFDASKYENYSPALMSASSLIKYLAFFSIYAATISYAYLWHRHEIWMGLKGMFKRGEKTAYQDVHNRLMSAYPEVSEWWYLAVLLFAIGCSIGGVAGWDTYTTVGVVFYGLALCLVFVIPVGLIFAITGLEVTLNVLAEFIGGSWVAGNALAMNYFKSFGYVTCAHALRFCNDLKMAHYVKIPPRHTFWAQIVGTLVSSFICTAVMNFQMNNIADVCESYQANHFTCPGINTFFTAAVLWGTIGPIKVFGKGGQYTWLLIGFPIGFFLPILVYYARKKWPKTHWLRFIHPVCIFNGPIQWAPYNVSYMWPTVPVAWLSHVYLKTRYTAFWSKYNYVVSAAFSAAIAIAAIVIFFALQWSSVSIDWWGNSVSFQGCEDDACTRYTVADGEYFGPRIGQFH
ncbi:Sexual differentiation process protein isp4 [Lasiodiplodia hormozganensis]|uniref:Sexual differentiation process protein isp4 n=1 Tax=Lasiodiplodia hormozganensis TaxID=869390 RepID=A0AA39U1Q8_9PEZI|nr:Sexual differentiation process protein isp4 [Lasiodiplodia hormozganensis]